jgi:hypothetical protein
MKTRTVLYAEDGMVLTNGAVYGKLVFLAEREKPESYYEIPEEAYLAQLKAQEAQADSVRQE